jgi:hypothetical protein
MHSGRQAHQSEYDELEREVVEQRNHFVNNGANSYLINARFGGRSTRDDVGGQLRTYRQSEQSSNSMRDMGYTNVHSGARQRDVDDAATQLARDRMNQR